MVAKTIFWYCAIMLIYSYSRENNRVDLNFFASKEAYQIGRQLEKITVKKGEVKVVKCAKNKSWVPRSPPLGHLSVKNVKTLVLMVLMLVRLQH